MPESTGRQRRSVCLRRSEMVVRFLTTWPFSDDEGHLRKATNSAFDLRYQAKQDNGCADEKHSVRALDREDRCVWSRTRIVQRSSSNTSPGSWLSLKPTVANPLLRAICTLLFSFPLPRVGQMIKRSGIGSI
jgi:hypothetical protein